VLYATGSTVVAAWEDQRSGGGWGDVRMNRSTDGGATWLTSDVRLDTDAPGSALSTSITIAGSGANVFVAWQDRRDGVFFDVRLNGSLDGGATWMASDVRLDTDEAGVSQSGPPQIVATGQKVRAVWDDARSGLADVYFTRSDP
jgi:hypothetical protein